MSNARSGELSEERCSAATDGLIECVVDLKEEQCLAEMRRLLADGHSPMGILAACTEGMRRVGRMFEQGEYFIAALIMAGEIMREATELLGPHLAQRRAAPGIGTALLGTIQGDIHDLGKNLFALLLQANGFTVIDLGVDVAPETFAAQAEELRPDLVGISCVLTLGLEPLKAAVELLHTRLPEPRPPVIIGGACIDERAARFVQADRWARDAAGGMRVALELLEGGGGGEAKEHP